MKEYFITYWIATIIIMILAMLHHVWAARRITTHDVIGAIVMLMLAPVAIFPLMIDVLDHMVSNDIVLWQGKKHEN